MRLPGSGKMQISIQQACSYDLRTCISNKLPGHASVHQTYLELEGLRGPQADDNKRKSLYHLLILFSFKRLSQATRNKAIFFISQTKSSPKIFETKIISEIRQVCFQVLRDLMLFASIKLQQNHPYLKAI